MTTRTRPRQRKSRTSTVHVMVVEDNEMIVRLVTHMLADEPGVELALGGSDVTALMDESIWRDIDVALVDLLLPKTTGDVLLEWLKHHAPHVRRVAMSGSGPHRLANVRNADVKLLKPFMLDELVASLRP